jgi:hypothetical protein
VIFYENGNIHFLRDGLRCPELSILCHKNKNMKKIISITIAALFMGTAFSQTDSLLQKRTGTKPVRVSTSPKTSTAILGTSEKNLLVPKLPDLRITSLDVKFFNSTSPDANARYFTVSYTLKNEGVTDVKLFDIKLQGFITGSFEDATGTGGGYMPASSNVTDILKPGASYNGSYQTSGANAYVAYAKFFRLYVDYPNTVKEINENNNTVATAVMIQ